VVAATGIVSVALFVVILWATGAVRAASGVLTTARESMTVMRDRGVDDRARERAMQQASVRLFGDFVSILARVLLSFGVSLFPIWAANRVGLAAWQRVVDFLSRADVALAISGVMLLGYFAVSRLWPSN
jgi:hypothetical protein